MSPDPRLGHTASLWRGHVALAKWDWEHTQPPHRGSHNVLLHRTKVISAKGSGHLAFGYVANLQHSFIGGKTLLILRNMRSTWHVIRYSALLHPRPVCLLAFIRRWLWSYLMFGALRKRVLWPSFTFSAMLQNVINASYVLCMYVWRIGVWRINHVHINGFYLWQGYT